MVVWKKVKDTRLARKMYPDFEEKEDGFILIPEPLCLDASTFGKRIHIANTMLQMGLITTEEYMKMIDDFKQK